MGTPANIIIELSDNVFESISVNYDGYPDHTLDILENHYMDRDKVNAMIALGDLSSLYQSIECPEGHTFDSQVKGYSVFYGRDRGEANTRSIKNSYINDHNWSDYSYMFTLDGKWKQL